MARIRMFDLSLRGLKDLAIETLDKWESTDSVAERKKLNATLEEIISQYGADSKAACYRAARESGDPMAYACQEFFYATIRVKETKDKETGEVVRSIDDAQKSIDLADLHDNTKGGIGQHLVALSDGDEVSWKTAIQTFNGNLTYRAADRLNDGTTKELLRNNPGCYRLSEAARKLEVGELTDDEMLADIDKILKAMIGDEYEADEKDLHSVQDNYISNDRKSKTSFNAANHRTMIELFKKICYRHLNGCEGYGVVSRELKNK